MTLVGVKQNEINKRSLELNQFVDVYIRVRTDLICNKVNKATKVLHKIEVRNSGNISLSIVQWEKNGNPISSYLPYRLPPCSIFNDAFYYFVLEENDNIVVFNVKFIDSIGRHWKNQIKAKKFGERWEVSCDKLEQVIND